MAHHHCNCEQRRASALDAMAHRLAGFQRLSWREALGGVTLAAGRLHRYRDLHTRMLHDALCERDCSGAPARRENVE